MAFSMLIEGGGTMTRTCRLLAITLSLMLACAGTAAADGSGVMAMPGEACNTPAKPDWSDAEKWAWGKICVGEAADMADYADGPIDPKSDDAWPKGRDLSARFLEAILLVEPFRSAVPIKGVAIEHAHFGDVIDLSNASLIRALWFWDSRFDKTVSMLTLRSPAPVGLDGSWFGDSLDFQRAQIDGSILMRSVVVKHKVTMEATKIGSILDLTGADVGGDVSFTRLATGGGVILDASTLGAELSVYGAHIGERLSLNGVHVVGNANMERMVLSGTLFADADDNAGPARFDGGVDLLGATIAGGSEFRAARVGRKLTFEQASVGGYLWLSGDDHSRGDFGQIDLVGTHIGSGVQIHGASFHGLVNFEDARVDQSVEMYGGVEFYREVRMDRAKLGGNVDITDAIFDGPVNMRAIQVGTDLLMHSGTEFDRDLDLSFSRISENLDMTEGTFTNVNLTGAMIASEIRLGAIEAAVPTWRARQEPEKTNEVQLILRNVSAGALQDLPKSWPDHVDLEGFTYARLGGFGSPAATLGGRKTSELLTWLEKQDGYSPQSYMQLAAVFRSSGYPSKADWILFNGKLRELFHARPDQFIFLFLYCITTGFGIYPQVAALWVILLVAIGTFVFGRDKEPTLAQMNWTDRAIYSLDMLIPVVHLRGKNYGFEPASNRARYYLYFHRFAGFLLASVLIASMTHGGIELHS
jgi:hypothetical protein